MMLGAQLAFNYNGVGDWPRNLNSSTFYRDIPSTASPLGLTSHIADPQMYRATLCRDDMPAVRRGAHQAVVLHLRRWHVDPRGHRPVGSRMPATAEAMDELVGVPRSSPRTTASCDGCPSRAVLCAGRSHAVRRLPRRAAGRVVEESALNRCHCRSHLPSHSSIMADFVEGASSASCCCRHSVGSWAGRGQRHTTFRSSSDCHHGFVRKRRPPIADHPF